MPTNSNPVPDVPEDGLTAAAKQYAAGLALPPDDRDELLATVRQHAFIQDAEESQR